VSNPKTVSKPDVASTSRPAIGADTARRITRKDVARWFSFRNASALYVFVVIFVVFSITIPQTFLTIGIWASLLDNQAVTAIAAIALVIPLSAGVFNLAIGSQVGLGSIAIGWLLVTIGVPLPLAIILTALMSAVIGLVAGLIIVRAHIDSFIATLGVSSLLAALITFLSGGRQILNMPASLSNFGIGRVFGITYAVIAMLIIAVIVWYVLERTPLGRRIYATGGNLEAARLSGIKTSFIIVGSLVACGLLTGVAGMVVTARLANADPTIGPAYLLPAFTAAFLGSTQFKSGRFNIWGTVVSVYVLAAGVKGLQLSGAPVWIPDAFNGAALLVAVGIASAARMSGRRSILDRMLGRNRPQTADTEAASGETPA
jgi:ribose transport system permease protein